MKFPNPLTFIAAVGRVFWGRIRGYRLFVTEQEEAFRWTQCQKCEYLINSERAPGVVIIVGQCSLCTCYLAGKLPLATEKCPINRWGRIWKKKPSLTNLIKNRTTK